MDNADKNLVSGQTKKWVIQGSLNRTKNGRRKANLNNGATQKTLINAW